MVAVFVKRTTALPLVRVFSGRLHCLCLATPTLLRGFPGKRFQKPSGTTQQLLRLPIHHRITRSRMLPLGVALTRLSYPSTPAFAGCQIIQVSPQIPAPLLAPQKPTCLARSIAFRLLPWAGLDTGFHGHQVLSCYQRARFVVAQPFVFITRAIESKGAFQPLALVSAAPALLEACG